MKKRTDLQELIPVRHRDLIEAVPRGFPRSAVTGALLFGGLGGSLLTYIMPSWAAGAILAALAVAHLIYKHRSDKVFDERMAALQERGVDWEADDNP